MNLDAVSPRSIRYAVSLEMPMSAAVSGANCIIADDRSGRIRVRSVDHREVAARALEKARETGQPRVQVRHGGSVCNTYGYPAATEAVLAVAFPLKGDFVAVVYASQLAANKVTLRGAAARCLPCAGALFDRRCNAATKAAAKAATVRQAKADYFQKGDAEALAKRRERDNRRTQSVPSLRERLFAFKETRAKLRLLAAGYWATRHTHAWVVGHADTGELWRQDRLPTPAEMDRRREEVLAARAEAERRRREYEEERQRTEEERYERTLAACTTQGCVIFNAEGGFRVEPSCN